ncbi:MAG: helix-turn-helix transcriptional regulator [Gemmatimonadetes bacterium]|nr:helix-turn-helix transcriptional regulator [Gemmatimonadota bacterium]
MPPRRGLKTSPCDYLAAGGTWPEGPLADDAPNEARFAMEVGQRLKAHCDANSLSMNAVSRATNVHTQTVINLLAGRTWGDLPIIWRLEAGLGTLLWVNSDLCPEG